MAKNKNIIYFRPDRVLKKIYWLVKACKRFYSPLSFRYYIFLISFIKSNLQGGFTISQVYELGLGSFPSNEDINKYISQRKIKKIDKSINHLNWRRIVNNKEIFYKICRNLNLPQPELYALIFKDHPSISYLNSSLFKREDIAKFIREELPDEFVIKPTGGSAGRFINIYTKTCNGIFDGFGQLKTDQDIMQSIMKNKRYNSFIVQERLRNHHYLLKLHTCENLHTIRIITLISSSGQVKILHGHLNVAAQEYLASQKSDLKISISLSDGSLEYGIYVNRSMGGFKKVTKHPETGIKFEEFKMPFWKEVLTLTEKVALEFLPLRTIGWDFAITENGAKLLEANVDYTPPNFFETRDIFKKTFFDNLFLL